MARNSVTGLLIYCQDPQFATYSGGVHRVLSSYQMTATVSIKVLTSFVSPFLLDKNLNLPLFALGSLALIGSFVVAIVFLFRIKHRFHNRGQSYIRLSKSLYKLEAELWDSEIERTQSPEVTPESTPKSTTKKMVEVIDGVFSSDDEVDEVENKIGGL